MPVQKQILELVDREKELASHFEHRKEYEALIERRSQDESVAIKPRSAAR